MHDGDVLTPASRNTIRRAGGGRKAKKKTPKNLDGVNLAEVKMTTDVEPVWRSRRKAVLELTP